MTAASLSLQSLAQISSERMLNCAVEGLGIALLAWMLLRVIGRQNSGTRFAVWFSTLLGIAALPLFDTLSATGTGLTRQSEITMPASWAIYIFGAWALIAVAGLIRVGAGFWHLQRLRKGSRPIDVASLDPLLRKTLEEFDSPRTVTVCVSDQMRVPTAIGFVQPRVVLPSWTMRELSATELNTILLHELAHLRRWDDWTNLIQKVLGALFFFHPAVWWIEKKLTLEREMACDDLVLSKTASPRVYAECLVSLAEKNFLRRGLALAQAAVSRMRQVSLRVSQILDVNRPRATRVWRPAPVMLTGVWLACLLALSDAPRLVSFESGSGSRAESVVESVAAITPASLEPGNVSGLHVIPARFEQPLTARSSVAAAAGKTGPEKKTSRPALVPAKSLQPRMNAPMVVLARASDQAVSFQTLVFVVRTEVVQPQLGRDAYDGASSVVWSLSVWRVTVIGPLNKQMESGIIVKSI